MSVCYVCAISAVSVCVGPIGYAISICNVWLYLLCRFTLLCLQCLHAYVRGNICNVCYVCYVCCLYGYALQTMYIVLDKGLCRLCM